MKTLVFRCSSMSSADYHYIEIPEKGPVICTCKGESWCSHIEATLVAGERAMVHPEDRTIADKAQVMAKGRIGPPENWKSNWRSNKKWRGIKIRPSKAMQFLNSGMPVVCFDESSKTKECLRIASDNGWSVVSRPTKGVIIHVSNDIETDTSKQAAGRGITIVTTEQWESVASIGHTLKDRMSDLLASQ